MGAGYAALLAVQSDSGRGARVGGGLPAAAVSQRLLGDAISTLGIHALTPARVVVAAVVAGRGGARDQGP